MARSPQSAALSQRPINGFAAVVGKAPRVLILGSMPSARSLQEGEYYAHPRNAFWPIMDALGLASAGAAYSDRLKGLKRSGVAVWDSLQQCERSGSLDAAIVESTEQANDFTTLFAQYPTLRVVVFNGTKAEKAFRRHVLLTLPAGQTDRLTFLRLPSTSPAHAISLERKTTAWSAILPLLEPEDRTR